MSSSSPGSSPTMDIEHCAAPTLVIDADTRAVLAASATARAFFANGGELVGRSVDDWLDVTPEAVREPYGVAALTSRRDGGSDTPGLVALASVNFHGSRAICLSLVPLPPSAAEPPANPDFTEFGAGAQPFVTSQFVEGLSHAVRTPMTAILNAAELLRQTNLDSEQTELVSVIADSGSALVGSFNDLLDRVYIDSGRVTLNNQEFDLNATVRQTVVLFGQSAFEKGLVIETRFSHPDSVRVVGDAKRIGQMLHHLIGDAIQASSRGRIVVEVEVLEETAADCRIRLTVSESSPHRMFGADEEEFRRHRIRGAMFAGPGSSIALVRNLTVQMGGTIGVGSDARDHRAVYVELTLPKGDGAASTGLQRRGRRREALRLLLVDDNHLNLMMMRKVLESQGVVVEVARDGSEAVSLFEQGQYDAVFMDLHMPRVDGFAATKRIRDIEGAIETRTPIIALTADIRPEVEDECRRVGMNGLLAKPFSLEELRVALDELGFEVAGASA